MTNFRASFRQEVQRLARKEIRAELESTRKVVSRHRQEIAELKRRNKEPGRMIKALQLTWFPGFPGFSWGRTNTTF